MKDEYGDSVSDCVCIGKDRSTNNKKCKKNHSHPLFCFSHKTGLECVGGDKNILTKAKVKDIYKYGLC